MSEAVCLYEKRGPAAWITLNRPEKLNALNGDVLEGSARSLRSRGGRRRGQGGGADRRGRPGLLGRLRPRPRRPPHAYIRAHEWHERAGCRHRRHDEAVVAAQADDRRRARLLPGGRVRAGDGLRHDRRGRVRALRRAGDSLRVRPGDAADAVHPRPEEDQRAAVHRRHDRCRDGRAGGDDQPCRRRRRARVRGRGASA